MKRTPFIVKVRCIYNGADTTRLLYLKTEADAHETMKRYVPKRERNALRVLETRPATEAEIKEHKERMVAILGD